MAKRGQTPGRGARKGQTPTGESESQDMRVFGRQDSLLVIGLAAAAAVIMAPGVARLLDVAREVEQTYGVALIPAFLILTFFLILHQQGKRQQMKAAAQAAAAAAEDAQTRAQELEVLVNFGQSLARSLDVESIRDALQEHLPQLAGSDGIWVLTRADGHWHALLGGNSLGRWPGSDGASPQERLADRALSLESDRRAEFEGLEWDGHVCFPMIAAGKAVGVLGVPEIVPLSDGRRRMLAAVAAMLAVSLKNAQLFREVRDTSQHDGLTGLVNRKHGIEILDTELRRARRSQTPLSIIMFDIDHFKDINDRYGHLCGDAVLATVARRARQVLRGTDLKCRYGGEEFLVLLPDTRPDGAMRVAETLRRDIAETPIPWSLDTVTVTASFGVACARPDEVDADALVGRADAAMYGAKEDGRNRVRLAADRGPIAHPRSA